VFTTAFTTITTFEVVLFCKHNVSFGAIIEIFRIELFVKHNGLKDKEVIPIVIIKEFKRKIIIYKDNADITSAEANRIVLLRMYNRSKRRSKTVKAN
jgi:hypothetical protein